MFSDDIGGRLKALASTKLKVEMANSQSRNRVRTTHTLRADFKVPRDSQWGVWHSHARDRFYVRNVIFFVYRALSFVY